MKLRIELIIKLNKEQISDFHWAWEADDANLCRFPVASRLLYCLARKFPIISQLHVAFIADNSTDDFASVCNWLL